MTARDYELTNDKQAGINYAARKKRGGRRCLPPHTGGIYSVARDLSIKKRFHDIIGFIVGPAEGGAPVPGVDISGQFRPGERDDVSLARNLNTAFCIALSGHDAPCYGTARGYLEGARGAAAEFFIRGIGLIEREVEERYGADAGFRHDVDALHGAVTAAGPRPAGEDAIARLWRLFFPEGVSRVDFSSRVAELREKRRVRITAMNPRPVRTPEREVLFTANALLTVPPRPAGAAGLSPGVREAVGAAAAEEQRHWYDHPVPVTDDCDNEIVYGLRNLSEAVLFEEGAGCREPGADIDCVLSVSVTHPSLRGAAGPWLASLLAHAGPLRGVSLYPFTEDDTVRLLDEVLVPAARRWLPGRDDAPLREVFGVDGEYGRHYSFLKAIASFWRVFIAPEIRAVFKIDLDQVFPQEELVRVTGASAFGHLKTPLWGARGVDSGGEEVYLGMLAGALVNRRDIGASLFTPDVPYPENVPAGDEAVFRSAAPQAVSTAAEMANGPPGAGGGTAVQRVHVTGGTTGILTEALERYRPFTPSCIGRAEDQAYLLSVLFRHDERGFLRYAHCPGLVMRHDADLFAEAAASARNGKAIGDLVRILLFSDYARALPWPEERVKEAVDPFTGAFISRIPITIVYLRFALRAARLFAEDPGEGLRFFNEGVRRLSGMMGPLRPGENAFTNLYAREQRGWDLYYDVLAAAEKNAAGGDGFALELTGRARAIVRSLKACTGA